MVREIQHIESDLREQSQYLALPQNSAVTWEQLEQTVQRRARIRRLQRWSWCLPCLALLLFALQWIPSDRPLPIANTANPSLSSEQPHLEKPNSQPRIQPSIDAHAPSRDPDRSTPRAFPVTASPSQAPFRVYATWKIPVRVRHQLPDGTVSELIDFLEVQRPLDTRSLDHAEIERIHQVLPHLTQRSIQL